MTDIDGDTLARAHRMSYRNRPMLEGTGRAACFGCLAEVQTARVTEYVDAGQTALCPHCGLDTLLPMSESDSLDSSLLTALNERYLRPA